MAKQVFTTGQILTAAQMTTLQANDYNQTVSAKTANYTLVAADAGTRITMNNAGATTITVNTSVFTAGDTLTITNIGAGVCTITAGTATVSTSSTLALKQYDSGQLYFTSTGVAIFFASDAADSPLTTKGDLFTFSTNDARLAVGNSGETLVADSAQSTGLRYNPPVGSLANPFINGGMDIWQRGTSISIAASTGTTFLSDRWATVTNANQAITVSRQSTGDTTNLPNIQYCMRYQRNSGQTGTGGLSLVQSLETTNSLPFAGKAITMSFYARKGADYSASSSALVAYVMTGTGTDQNRLGGYTGDNTSIVNSVTLTTTWQRFVVTGTIPTTATEFSAFFSFTPTGTASTNDYYEITGVQLDVGTWTASTAPTFRRSGGTLQGETALCQRYYYLVASGASKAVSMAAAYSASRVDGVIHLPVTMRTTPTLVQTTGSNYYSFLAATSDDFNDITALNNTGTNVVGWYTNTNVTVTSGQAGYVYLNNASSSIALSAEL